MTPKGETVQRQDQIPQCEIPAASDPLVRAIRAHVDAVQTGSLVLERDERDALAFAKLDRFESDFQRVFR